MSWTDHVMHATGVLSISIFAGAAACAAATITASIAPQWRRIARLACGHIEPQAASDAPHASCTPQLRAVEADVQPTFGGVRG